jgi:glycosyltransferase involved in cell wall biosynthesis
MKEDLLKQTDIFVLPSLFEAQPLSILEAMAAGCPVVSTWHGAIPETVIDGETGILVEKEDAKELSRALKKLIAEPKLREKMGLMGRKRYQKYYTKERHIENMIDVFKKTLDLCVESQQTGWKA